MPSVDVGDISMYYELSGQGQPLVLIGGLGSDHTVFRHMSTELARDFRVLTFDNRGAGQTSKPDVPYSIPMMADDTIGLMDALGIERAHVIGISMGGRIAIELAATHPERVDHLVLISTAATGTGRLRLSVPARILRTAARLGLLPRGPHPQPDFAFQRQLAASVSYDGAGQLSAITAPTLILHARNDRTMPLASAEATSAGIDGARIEVYKGGHMFFVLSQRDAVVTRIVQFLTPAS
jgi:3-oxoadipate enol-lactonase